jgi:hypothetical protein
MNLNELSIERRAGRYWYWCCGPSVWGRGKCKTEQKRYSMEEKKNEHVAIDG